MPTTQEILASKFQQYGAKTNQTGAKAGIKRPESSVLKKIIVSTAEGFKAGQERAETIVTKGEELAAQQKADFAEKGVETLGDGYSMVKEGFFRVGAPLAGAVQGALSAVPVPTYQPQDTDSFKWRSLNDIVEDVRSAAPQEVKDKTVAIIKEANDVFQGLPPGVQQFLRESLGTADIVTTLAPAGKLVKELEGSIKKVVKGLPSVAKSTKEAIGTAVETGKQKLQALPQKLQSLPQQISQQKELFLQNLDKIQPTIQKYISKYKAGVDKAKLDSALEVVTPKLTPKIKKYMFKAGKLESGTFSPKINYKPDDYKMANAVAKIDGFKEGMGVEDSYKLVKSQIVKNSDEIERHLLETGVTYTQKEREVFLNIIKSSVENNKAVLFGNDKTLQKYYMSVVEEFEKSLPTEGTLLDIWQSRKKLDQVFKDTKGAGAFDKNSLQAQALKDIRNMANDYIGIKSKDTAYKEFLDETAALYRAGDNMDTHAGTMKFSKVLDKFDAIEGFYRRNPAITLISTVGVGATAVLTPGVIIGGAALFGGAKLSIAAFKKLKSGFVKALEAIDHKITNASSSYVKILEKDKKAIIEAMGDMKSIDGLK